MVNLVQRKMDKNDRRSKLALTAVLEILRRVLWAAARLNYPPVATCRWRLTNAFMATRACVEPLKSFSG